MHNTFRKTEKLCSKKAINQIFAGTDSKSMSAYPLRAVFRHTEEAGNRILVSVSKRYFKHAVDRNRCKRQVREAYRLNKHLLANLGGLHIAFIWISRDLQPTDMVMRKVTAILTKIASTPTPPCEDSARSSAAC